MPSVRSVHTVVQVLRRASQRARARAACSPPAVRVADDPGLHRRGQAARRHAGHRLDHRPRRPRARWPEAVPLSNARNEPPRVRLPVLGDGWLDAALGPTPATRADCPSYRPCPHVRCEHHLWQVYGVGRAAAKVIDLAIADVDRSCALDEAARGSQELAAIGRLVPTTRRPRKGTRRRVSPRRKEHVRRLVRAGARRLGLRRDLVDLQATRGSKSPADQISGGGRPRQIRGTPAKFREKTRPKPRR